HIVGGILQVHGAAGGVDDQGLIVIGSGVIVVIAGAAGGQVAAAAALEAGDGDLRQDLGIGDGLDGAVSHGHQNDIVLHVVLNGDILVFNGQAHSVHAAVLDERVSALVLDAPDGEVDGIIPFI